MNRAATGDADVSQTDAVVVQRSVPTGGVPSQDYLDMLGLLLEGTSIDLAGEAHAGHAIRYPSSLIQLGQVEVVVRLSDLPKVRMLVHQDRDFPRQQLKPAAGLPKTRLKVFTKQVSRAFGAAPTEEADAMAGSARPDEPRQPTGAVLEVWTGSIFDVNVDDGFVWARLHSTDGRDEDIELLADDFDPNDWADLAPGTALRWHFASKTEPGGVRVTESRVEIIPPGEPDPATADAYRSAWRRATA
jgi:hypothetical protein